MTPEKIAIITDSTCDLPNDITSKYGIYVLPLKIIYPNEEYHDRVDIQPENVYKRFPEEIPSTSLPGAGEVKAVLDEIRAKGIKKILAIHISSGLSGTYNMVKMVAQDYPDLSIEVIDSKALSYGLGFLVLTAAKLREAGIQFSDMVASIQKAQAKVKVFFVVKTLEYLKKGGRIGLVSATLGEILDLKPIISINGEGKYFTFTKVRSRKKSLEKVKEILIDFAKGKPINLAVMHGDAETEALAIRQELLQDSRLNIVESFWGQIGPSMVVHTGPGLVGLAFHEVEEY